jgi:hypothetical protein
MTTFEKLSANYSEITLQNLSIKSPEELLTMLLKIIQNGYLCDVTKQNYGKFFEISTDTLADILRGREI